ncbi:MAG: nickel-responsive transcriptional regulator NikR, partial [Acidobacteria bacterium]|nr:nickel-responsive transcriptional regulator NikR [Acidobacteriota bacterium]
AIRDLIRDCLVEEDIEANKDTIVGVVSLVYNHHKLDLPKKLTDEQHKNHSMFLSTLHIHLDSHNCLEVLLLKGPGDEVKNMADALISTKGIKHGKLTITTTGSELE